MENTKKETVSLTLFGETASGEAGMNTPSQSGEQQADAAPAGDEVSRLEQFESLIQGEYKDLYDKRVAQIVQKRLKNLKESQSKWEQAQEILTTLANRYGVEQQDLTALKQAVAKEEKKPENRGNSSYPQGDLAGQIYSDLVSQARELTKVYPTFNVEKELKNPRFASYLRVPGVDMQTAYELAHKEEILPAVIAAAESQVENRIAKSMMSSGLRPRENGNASQSAPLVRHDVSTFTKAQMDDICKRVSLGEKIYL